MTVSSRWLDMRSIVCILLLGLLSVCHAATWSDLQELSAVSETDRDVRVDLPQLHIRDDTDQTASASPSAASPTATTAAATSAAAQTSAVSIPQPFDTSLGNNFTQASCPSFFESFLGSSAFQACIPFSLLLQNSNAWFQVSASNVTLNPILNKSCSVSFQTCAPLMTSLATQLIAPSNCAQDYSLRNPLVVQAYRGLISYTPMYHAACLKADPTGKSTSGNFPYCYTSSLNSSSGADSFLYFLPLGLGLPGGTSISCSSCTQQIMEIYAQAAPDPASPLNQQYLPAANMINSACGNNFVDSSSSATKTASGTTATGAGSRLCPLSCWHIASCVMVLLSLCLA